MLKPDKREKINKALTRIAAKVDCTKPPRVGIKTRFIFKMMGNMHAAGWDASPVEKEYWQSRGWLGKKRPWTN